MNQCIIPGTLNKKLGSNVLPNAAYRLKWKHVKTLCLIWKAIKNGLQTSMAFHTYITKLSLLPGLIQSQCVLGVNQQ